MPLLFPKPGWVVAPRGGTAFSVLMGRWVSPPHLLPSFPGACQCLASCNSVASLCVACAMLLLETLCGSRPTAVCSCWLLSQPRTLWQQKAAGLGAEWSRMVGVNASPPFPFAEPKICHSLVWWHLHWQSQQAEAEGLQVQGQFKGYVVRLLLKHRYTHSPAPPQSHCVPVAVNRFSLL